LSSLIRNIRIVGPAGLDVDVAAFFDSVPWDLMVKAVQANIGTEQRWVLLYVKRWLAAPLQLPDGTLVRRDRGTPQGSAISPALANLFLHYAFDTWVAREFPTVEFERYADDAVVHCVSERQARTVLAALAGRMVEVGLRLHPDKTKSSSCRSSARVTGPRPRRSARYSATSLASSRSRSPVLALRV
jgi:RNA-directed DNA polymerase